jgi:hypothetical protein
VSKISHLFVIGVLVSASPAAPQRSGTQGTPAMPAMTPPPDGESCDSDGSNRAEAQQFTDTFNRMMDGVNAMAAQAYQRSLEQARQSGGAVTVQQGGAMPTVAPIGENFTRAFEMMLDCAERRQMAAATEQAIAGPVGTAARWTSASRPNVSGSSTVTATEAAGADGSHCLTVTDIIIIDGQETRAPKRMCRVPPSNRYVRSA